MKTNFTLSKHMRSTVLLISLFAAVTLLFITFASFVEAGAAEPTVSVSSLSARSSDTVEITVSLDNNPGIISASFVIDYDSDVLTLQGVRDAGELGSAMHSSDYSVPYTLSWQNNLVMQNFTYSGIVATLSFKVNATAPAGTYPIEVSYIPQDVVDIDFNNITFACSNGAVEVLPEPVTGVTLDRSEAYLALADDFTLVPSIQPVNAANKAVSWSSSNPSVATVTNGKVDPVSVGEAVISVITADGGKTASCTVNVTSDNFNNLKLTAINNGTQYSVTGFDSYASGEIEIPEEYNGLPVTQISDGAFAGCSKLTDITVPNSVSAIGVDAFKGCDGITVHCYDNSAAHIYAQNNSISFSLLVYTEPTVAVTGIELDKQSITVATLRSEAVTATVAPFNATNKAVIWSSDNESIATVVNGVVNGVSVGTTTVRAKTADGGYAASCQVTVNASVTEVSLDITQKEIYVGESFTLTPSVFPVNAVNKAVTWSSSDENVVTVLNGEVKALGAGTAVVTVTTVDFNKTASCSVKVNSRGSITVSKATAPMGADVELTVTLADNPGIAMANFRLEYDTNILTFVKAVDAGKLGVAMHGASTVFWNNPTATSDFTYNGVAVTLTFSINENALPGIYPVRLSYNNEYFEVINVNMDTVDIACIDGSVTVVEPQPITFDFADGEYTYDGSAHALEATNVQDGATVTYENNENIDVGTYTVTATAQLKGYKTTTKTATLKINPKAVTVTGIVAEKAYDGTVDVAVLGGTLEGIAQGDDVSAVIPTSGKFDNAEPGFNKIVTLDEITLIGTDKGNYVLIQPTVMGSIVIPVSSVTLDKATAEMHVNDVITLTATVSPDNAENKAVTWSSSDETVVTVSNGEVTAVGAGNAVITVTTVDGGKTASCEIEVKAFLYGDVDGDGQVTNRDSAIVARHLAKWAGYEATNPLYNFDAADVDIDGQVTNRDSATIARHLAKWAGYEVLPMQ